MIWTFIGIFMFIQLSSSQYDDTEEEFQCNFCVYSRKKKDVTEDYAQDPDCMNHLKFGSRMDMRRTCTSNEKYCMSSVTNLNGLFVMVERDCTSDCVEGCNEHGYGLFWTECTRCCETSLCNAYDGREYYLPNGTPIESSILLCLFMILGILINIT